MILNMTGAAAGIGGAPVFTYTGNYSLLDDGRTDNVQNWRIKLLSSGTLTFTRAPGNIDVFLVGGGGGGYMGGGGGGYTVTQKEITPVAGRGYEILIGAGGDPQADGGSTKAFELTAKGGYGAISTLGWGNAGGSAGGCASNTGAAEAGAGDGGSRTNAEGQGSTTREFGETGATMYAGGGGGGTTTGTAGAGGAGGGGAGSANSAPAGSGKANYGGGGGGSYGTPGSGSCGVVVIRNHR